MISDSTSLNRQIVWSTTVVAFVSLSAMFFGFTIYGTAYEWLSSESAYSEAWELSDFIVLGINVAIGQTAGAYVGWRLANRLVKPLVAVTEAARTIADGDFSGRATGQGTFGEADQLIADFNTMAEKLQRAERELLYSNSAIAHELRTPLTILRGRIQGLADGVYEPSQEMFLGLAKHVESLARIVEDLRTLSLMNAGRMELHLSTFDLAHELKDVVDLVTPSLAALDICVETSLTSATLTADRARIRQAVLAITDNAGRYAAGSRLVIKTWGDTATAHISIADNGPGMNDFERAQAFERFWRADEPRTRASGGSGLGLSVVKAIIEAHGGRTSILAGADNGTEVKIDIPMCGP